MTSGGEMPEQPGGHSKAGQPCAAGEATLAAPVIRLHLWLEHGEELYFGMGRAQLLMNVERLGSIKRAAEHMGMSYRAAWGKLQQSERALGVKLLENRGAKCEGLRLTDAARALVSAFEAWFAAVERASQEAARSLLPFGVQPFAPANRPNGQPDNQPDDQSEGQRGEPRDALHGIAPAPADVASTPPAHARPAPLSCGLGSSLGSALSSF